MATHRVELERARADRERCLAHVGGQRARGEAALRGHDLDGEECRVQRTEVAHTVLVEADGPGLLPRGEHETGGGHRRRARRGAPHEGVEPLGLRERHLEHRGGSAGGRHPRGVAPVVEHGEGAGADVRRRARRGIDPEGQLVGERRGGQGAVGPARVHAPVEVAALRQRERAVEVGPVVAEGAAVVAAHGGGAGGQARGRALVADQGHRVHVAALGGRGQGDGAVGVHAVDVDLGEREGGRGGVVVAHPGRGRGGDPQPVGRPEAGAHRLHLPGIRGRHLDVVLAVVEGQPGDPAVGREQQVDAPDVGAGLEVDLPPLAGGRPARAGAPGGRRRAVEGGVGRIPPHHRWA